MFTLPQEIFMNFAAILSTIRITSFVLFVAVMAVHTSTAVSHFHKELIKVELVLWLSLCMYCRAAKFCLHGMWFVVCDFVYMSFVIPHNLQNISCIISGAWH